jgi:hypothetical protein
VVRHENAGLTGVDTINVEEVTASSGYASGAVNFGTDGTTWTPVAAADLNFRIYHGASCITAIADYKLSDKTTQTHLVYSGGELYKNISGTMVAVSARDRLANTEDADELPSWAVGQDKFFITNNVEPSKMFYILNGTEYYENEGLAQPTTDPTITPTAGSALEDGTYYIDYYFWNDDLKQPSQRWKEGVADATNIATLVSEHIVITDLPAAPAREGDRATHIRIELREANSSIFRYVMQINIGVTTATINSATAATTVEAEYVHDPPPIHKIKAIAENRQFIADVVTTADSEARPYRLMFSAISGTTPYYSSFPALNFRDFGRGDNDYITGLWFVAPRTLIVGCKNSVWAIDARNPKTSDRFLITRNQGVASSQSGSVVGNKFFFFSNASANVGHYVWQQGEEAPQPILGIDDTTKSLEAGRHKYASCAAFTPGDDRYQWWTLLTAASGTRHTKILVYDYLLQAWMVFTKPSGAEGAVLGVIESSGIDRIYMGGYDGVEYLQDQGSQDGTTEFTAMFTLGVMDFGASHIRKRHRFIDMVANQESSGTITVNVELDYGSRASVNTTLNHLPAPGMGGTALVWGTGNWNETVWGDVGVELKRRSSLRGLADTFKHTFSSTAQFHIKGLSFGFQPTRRP